MNIEPTHGLSLHIENKISFSLRSSFLLYDLLCSFMENEKVLLLHHRCTQTCQK